MVSLPATDSEFIPVYELHSSTFPNYQRLIKYNQNLATISTRFLTIHSFPPLPRTSQFSLSEELKSLFLVHKGKMTFSWVKKQGLPRKMTAEVAWAAQHTFVLRESFLSLRLCLFYLSSSRARPAMRRNKEFQLYNKMTGFGPSYFFLEVQTLIWAIRGFSGSASCSFGKKQRSQLQN